MLLYFQAALSSDTDLDEWCHRLIKAIATHNITNRTNRFEPRVRKRRPKPYSLMISPRNDYKS